MWYLQPWHNWMSLLPMHEYTFCHATVQSSKCGTFDCSAKECHYFQCTYNMHLVAPRSKVLMRNFWPLCDWMSLLPVYVHPAFSRTVFESSECGIFDHCRTEWTFDHCTTECSCKDITDISPRNIRPVVRGLITEQFLRGLERKKDIVCTLLLHYVKCGINVIVHFRAQHCKKYARHQKKLQIKVV